MYKRLRDLREDNNLTQQQVADLINMSRTGYNQYETGKNDIPTKILLKLSKLYNTSIDYILENTNRKEPYPRAYTKKFDI